MNMQLKKWIAATLLLLLLFANVPFVGAATQEEIDAATQKRNELQQQLAEINRKLADIKDEVAKAEEKANTWATRVSIVQAQIEEINNSIALKTEELTLKQQELDIKEEQQQATYDLFKERLRAMYMNSRTSNLASMLAADSFADFLISAHNVSVISEHDTAIIDELIAEQEEIEEARAAIEIELDSLEADQQSLDSKYTELAGYYQEANSDLSSAEALQTATEADYKKILDSFYQTDAELKAMMGTGSPDYVGGYFAWPVPGYSYVSSGFGWRTLYGQPNWHGGIDIAGSGIYGANVIASNSGTVVRALYYTTGYGYHVMIYHGGNNWTVYGHLSQILVSYGDYVTQGTVIGKVGSTGNSTGPHLHFEIRLNGTKVNPLEYVVR